MMRHSFLLVLASAIVLAAGCMDDAGRGGGSLSLEDAVATTTVTMENNKYDPAGIRIGAGETVTWTNADNVGHNVKPANETQWGGPGSGDDAPEWLKNGESWSWTFTQAGTYYYYCTPHGYLNTATGDVGGMAGVVYVEGGASA